MNKSPNLSLDDNNSDDESANIPSMSSSQPVLSPIGSSEMNDPLHGEDFYGFSPVNQSGSSVDRLSPLTLDSPQFFSASPSNSDSLSSPQHFSTSTSSPEYPHRFSPDLFANPPDVYPEPLEVDFALSPIHHESPSVASLPYASQHMGLYGDNLMHPVVLGTPVKLEAREEEGASVSVVSLADSTVVLEDDKTNPGIMPTEVIDVEAEVAKEVYIDLTVEDDDVVVTDFVYKEPIVVADRPRLLFRLNPVAPGEVVDLTSTPDRVPTVHLNMPPNPPLDEPIPQWHQDRPPVDFANPHMLFGNLLEMADGYAPDRVRFAGQGDQAPLVHQNGMTPPPHPVGVNAPSDRQQLSPRLHWDLRSYRHAHRSRSRSRSPLEHPRDYRPISPFNVEPVNIAEIDEFIAGYDEALRELPPPPYPRPNPPLFVPALEVSRERVYLPHIPRNAPHLSENIHQWLDPPYVDPPMPVAPPSPPVQPIISCSVCLDSLATIQASNTRFVYSTNCGHVFCSTCIEDTVRTLKQCPNCRKRLTKKQYHRLFI